MSKTTQEQLDLRLASHKKYLETNGQEGERFNGSNEDFAGLNFKNANLRHAYLVGANLQDAKLEGANLRGANLVRAYLRDANLEGAYLVNAYLRDAKHNSATTFPDYFNPEKHKMINVDTKVESRTKLPPIENTPSTTTFDISLRDYFAAKALQGLLANPSCEDPFDSVVRNSINCADRMIELRDKPSEYKINREEKK